MENKKKDHEQKDRNGLDSSEMNKEAITKELESQISNHQNDDNEKLLKDQIKMHEKETKEEKKPKKPKDKYEDALKEIKEWEQKYMYLQAEMENSRKIMLKRIELARYNSKVDSIKIFLPIIESLEAAISKLDKNPPDLKEEGITAYLYGFKQVQKQFLQILQSSGVKPIDKENVPFNYREHEVMMKFEDESKPEDTVLKIVQKGWYLEENVLRPAKVIVSKRKQETISNKELDDEPENSGKQEQKPSVSNLEKELSKSATDETKGYHI